MSRTDDRPEDDAAERAHDPEDRDQDRRHEPSGRRSGIIVGRARRPSTASANQPSQRSMKSSGSPVTSSVNGHATWYSVIALDSAFPAASAAFPRASPRLSAKGSCPWR